MVNFARFGFVVFLSFALLVGAVNFASAEQVCSASTCPSACAAAGLSCSETPDSSIATHSGKQFTCASAVDVGCGFDLRWPLVQPNDCPSGYVHDDAVDKPASCGFLGLGALFGGSSYACHKSEQTTCSAQPACAAGSTKLSEASCAFQSQSTGTNQCCYVPDIAPKQLEREPDYGDIRALSIFPDVATLPVGGTLKFSAVGQTSGDPIVDVSATWNVSNSTVGQIASDGTFTACASCTGTARITAVVGPYTGTAILNVIDISDFRVDPASVVITPGAFVIYTASGVNSSGARVPISSSWTSSSGLVSLVGAGQTASSAVLQVRAGDVNGSINATLSMQTGTLKGVSWFNITEVGSRQVASLLTWPDSISTSEGASTPLLISAKDSTGVYMSPGTIVTDDAAFVDGTVEVTSVDPTIARVAVASGAINIQGVHAGSTTITVKNKAGITLSVPVVVIACTAGATMACGADDSWSVAEQGSAVKTCTAQQTWGACTLTDKCAADAAHRPQPNEVADGFACADWCADPASNDPDCACAASTAKACTDTATGCWGTSRCVDSRYQACVPSSVCTGRPVDSSAANGYFNGYACATTDAIPNPLALQAVRTCQQFGSARSAVAPNTPACTDKVTKTLTFSSETGLALNEFEISANGNAERVAKYSVADVQERAVMLNVTEGRVRNSLLQVLQVDQTLRFSAEVKLKSVNPTASATTKTADLEFTYDKCLFNVNQVKVIRR